MITKPATLKVGDRIAFRPNFGYAPQTTATVTGLDLTDRPREKYGREVASVTWDQVQDNRVLISLGDRWCYSEQVDGVVL